MEALGRREVLIIASAIDEASINIAKAILRICHRDDRLDSLSEEPTFLMDAEGWRLSIVLLQKDLAEAQEPLASQSPDLAVFISRHESSGRLPTLTAHVPGNLGEAKHGGDPRRVSIAPANAMKNALVELARQKERLGIRYLVSYEATHHGPSLDIPALFLEIGSTREEWSDHLAGEAVAYSALASLRETSFPVALALGGPHYNPKFTELGLKTELALGHIIPKYAIPSLDESFVRHCLERTLEKVEVAALDWKGIGSPWKRQVLKLLAAAGLEVMKV